MKVSQKGEYFGVREIRQFFLIFWQAIVPLFAYLAVESVVFGGWEAFFGQVIASWILPLTALSWAVTMIPLGMEYKRRRNREQSIIKISLKKAGYIAVAGIGGCLFFNGLLGLLPIQKEGYQQAAQVLYQPGLVVQLISMGIVIPLGEELVFRGLGYGRIRREIPGPAAAVLSAAYFGLYHGNLLQGIYAFFFGVFLAGIYEWGSGLLGCFLFHGAANMTAVLLQSIWQKMAGGFFVDGASGQKVWQMLMTLAGAGLMLICIRKIRENNNAQ
jgi:membrane protease YdiL (CAAX protease family)